MQICLRILSCISMMLCSDCLFVFELDGKGIVCSILEGGVKMEVWI